MSGLRQVRLGATGLPASVLGLGTVELGLPYGIGASAPPSEAEAIRLLHHALDLGITFFDTAAAYGRSEVLMGRAFSPRTRPTIATKVALTDGQGRPWDPLALEPGLAAALDRSRRRLRTEVLELVQIHNFTSRMGADADLSEALSAAMHKQVEAGTVRHWGASTYGAQAPRAALQMPVGTLQIAYSVLDRTLEPEVVPACLERGLGLILRSVFLKGVLTDRRRRLPPELAPLRAAAEAVATVADGLGLPLPEVALRFALYEAGAHVTLVGTADEAELTADVEAACAGPLPREAVLALRAIRVDDESLLNPGTWPDA